MGKNSLLLLYSSGSTRPSSFNYGSECASFEQTLCYAWKGSAAWKSTIQKCFLIQTPCLMCIAVGMTIEEMDVCHLRKCVVFGLHHEANTSNHLNCSKLSTSSDCLWCHCLFAWHCLRTYSLDTSYCIPFRTLSVTLSGMSLVNHSISWISTQQSISLNLFTFGPMLMGTFLLNRGWGIPRKSLWQVLRHPVCVCVCVYMCVCARTKLPTGFKKS